MKTDQPKVATAAVAKDRLLPKLTLKFFSLPRLTAILWIALTLFGILSYTTLLRREGFPSVQIPIAVINGAYFVNDPAKVDADVVQPISKIASQQAAVSRVSAQSRDNFYTVTIQYKEGTDGQRATNAIKAALQEDGQLPANVTPSYGAPYFGATGGDLEKIDVAISFYAKNERSTTTELVANAQQFADELEQSNLSNVASVTIKNPIQQVTNPRTGQLASIEQSFDRFGTREGSETNFYKSVLVTVAAKDTVDVIELDQQVREASERLIGQNKYSGYNADISASFAPAIIDDISELQKVLLEGLIAVLVVGSIVIAIRASFITVLSMVTVILMTISLLYLIGYTLNVITLFGLILGLSLIVDDTIIMVEAIEAARRKSKTAREAISIATRKVSRAMVAATTTAALCFLPLALVGGILGSFIRAIPVTIIASLFISLLVALIFIPFFSRFLLLTRKQFDKQLNTRANAKYEARMARLILSPMHWARTSRRRLVSVGLAAIFIAFGFIGAGIGLSQKVAFNIFPQTKDTNAIMVSVTFPAGTNLQSAQQLTQEAEAITARVLGSNFVEASYYANGSPQSASFQIELIPYGKRDVTSPQLVAAVKSALDAEFTSGEASVSQLDQGPPTTPFNIQIKGDDREASYRLAEDIKTYLASTTLERIDGTTARFTDINISSRDQVIRSDGTQIVQLSSGFSANDTTTLVTLAQTAIKDEFNNDRLQQYGLAAEAVSFDLGQESENQDSFKTLAITFPLLLVAIYLLLLLEFRSLLQPLLIFMAIPFSIFGLMLGLYLTDNAISFFASLGFFALIGLSIKNTILLTDFANQSRAAGLSAVDAAAAAVQERFRPLVATSLTAIVSLIPLAITSPFWQGLAVVLIFGLASSTILVLLVFPYFYLGVEYLRVHVSRRQGLLWTLGTLAAAGLVGYATNPGVGLLIFLISLLTLVVWALLQKPRYASS